MPNVIMSNADVAELGSPAVIKIDGICYELGGPTGQAITHTKDDVQGIHPTCEACSDSPPEYCQRIWYAYYNCDTQEWDLDIFSLGIVCAAVDPNETYNAWQLDGDNPCRAYYIELTDTLCLGVGECQGIAVAPDAPTNLEPGPGCCGSGSSAGSGGGSQQSGDGSGGSGGGSGGQGSGSIGIGSGSGMGSAQGSGGSGSGIGSGSGGSGSDGGSAGSDGGNGSEGGGGSAGSGDDGSGSGASGSDPGCVTCDPPSSNVPQQSDITFISWSVDGPDPSNMSLGDEGFNSTCDPLDVEVLYGDPPLLGGEQTVSQTIPGCHIYASFFLNNAVKGYYTEYVSINVNGYPAGSHTVQMSTTVYDETGAAVGSVTFDWSFSITT